MRILLVEDDSKIASFIVKGLKAAGYAVDHARDGETGLDMALTEPYDTAIIDIMLPKRDGLSLIETIRKEKIRTPVIILSAKGSIDDRVKGLQTGSDDYITKPFAFSEYTPSGCAVTVSLGEKDEYRVISVADTGIGISPGDLPRIFERFYRCDQSRSQEGIGLGLSLARAIARAHGGDITASSLPNQGSTFTVTLSKSGSSQS